MPKSRSKKHGRRARHNPHASCAATLRLLRIELRGLVRLLGSLAKPRQRPVRRWRLDGPSVQVSRAAATHLRAA